MDETTAAEQIRDAGTRAGQHLVDHLAAGAAAEAARAQRAQLDAEMAQLRLDRERWRAQIEQFQGMALLVLTVAAAWVLLIVGWKLAIS